MGTVADLAGIVDEICAYFQHKHPSSETLDTWFKNLERYDLRAARKHVTEQIQQSDSFPRNFPLAVRIAYRGWTRNQPREKSIPDGCRYCSHGLLHVEKDGLSFVFNCGHCRTSDKAYPEATRYWLEEHGYKIDWQQDYEGEVDKSALSRFKKTFGTVAEVEEIPF